MQLARAERAGPHTHSFVPNGDTLIVWHLDLLERSLQDLVQKTRFAISCLKWKA
jgi:hypothetical protein